VKEIKKTKILLFRAQEKYRKATTKYPDMDSVSLEARVHHYKGLIHRLQVKLRACKDETCPKMKNVKLELENKKKITPKLNPCAPGFERIGSICLKEPKGCVETDKKLCIAKLIKLMKKIDKQILKSGKK